MTCRCRWGSRDCRHADYGCDGCRQRAHMKMAEPMCGEPTDSMCAARSDYEAFHSLTPWWMGDLA